MPLKNLKDSYPIQIAEYATANKIANNQRSTGGYTQFYGNGAVSLRKSNATGEQLTYLALDCRRLSQKLSQSMIRPELTSGGKPLEKR